MALEIAGSSEANINAHPICIQTLETAEIHPVIELPPDLKNPDFSLSEQTNYMPWKRIIAVSRERMNNIQSVSSNLHGYARYSSPAPVSIWLR